MEYTIDNPTTNKTISYLKADDNKIINENGRVVNTYSLFGNNCTTTSCDALKAGGSNVWLVEEYLLSGIAIPPR